MSKTGDVKGWGELVLLVDTQLCWYRCNKDTSIPCPYQLPELSVVPHEGKTYLDAYIVEKYLQWKTRNWKSFQDIEYNCEEPHALQVTRSNRYDVWAMEVKYQKGSREVIGLHLLALPTEVPLPQRQEVATVSNSTIYAR